MRGASERLAWGVAGGVTFLAVALHVVVFLSAGGLWRDEGNAVAFGPMSLGETWANLPYDSMPLGFPLLIRLGWRMGLANDESLRGLGLLMGLLLLSALWFAARRLSGAPPLPSLVLFGLCPSGLRYGDSVRAYGLGSALGIAMLALVFEAVRAPTRRSVALASVAAALAMQFLYQNALLLAAAGAGGLALAGVGRRRERLIAMLAVVTSALFSLSLYLGRILATRALGDVYRRPTDVTLVSRRAALALLTPTPVPLALWLLAILVVPLAVVTRSDAAADRERSLFLLTSMIAALAGGTAFVISTGYEANPWHFIPFLAALAVTLDALASTRFPARAVAIATALAAALLAPSSWAFAHGRHTNVDRIATLLNERATSGDVVVVSPYYTGITFGRYYHGAGDWMALPNGDRPQQHHADRVHEAMLASDAIAPVRARVDAALAAGQRVYLVLDQPIFRVPPAPPQRPLIPDPVFGWHAGTSFRFWGLALGYELQLINPHAAPVAIPGDEEDVSPYERMLLIEVWPGAPSSAPG